MVPGPALAPGPGALLWIHVSPARLQTSPNDSLGLFVVVRMDPRPHVLHVYEAWKLKTSSFLLSKQLEWCHLLTLRRILQGSGSVWVCQDPLKPAEVNGYIEFLCSVFSCLGTDKYPT